MSAHSIKDVIMQLNKKSMDVSISSPLYGSQSLSQQPINQQALLMPDFVCVGVQGMPTGAHALCWLATVLGLWDPSARRLTGAQWS